MEAIVNGKNLGISKKTSVEICNLIRNKTTEKAKIIRQKHSLDMIGKNNPNWQGGKSFEPYTLDFNKQLKKSIRERDGCCMMCNLSFDDLHLLKRQIQIHHIDYDKLNSFKQNCLCLCNKCHSQTNFNRTHWTKFFQSLLAERYGYEYTEDQKIILDFDKSEIQ